MKRIALVTTFILFSTVLFFSFFSESSENFFPFINTSERSAIFIRDVPVKVEVADTPSARRSGLSGKVSLPQGQGMLFIFDEDDFHGIWMKDMLFAIDIIWIDNKFAVIDIKEDVQPESFPSIFRPSKRSHYVLEVDSGFVEKHNIKIGDIVQLNP